VLAYSPYVDIVSQAAPAAGATGRYARRAELSDFRTTANGPREIRIDSFALTPVQKVEVLHQKMGPPSHARKTPRPCTIKVAEISRLPPVAPPGFASLTAVITLTTDFGTGSPYVAAMKGVILAINPNVAIVDLTHDIPPQDIRAGAIALAEVTPLFPAGTIHIAVVDPGVGTARKIIYAEIGAPALRLPRQRPGLTVGVLRKAV
jgi:hypothetical protein